MFFNKIASKKDHMENEWKHSISDCLRRDRNQENGKKREMTPIKFKQNDNCVSSQDGDIENIDPQIPVNMSACYSQRQSQSQRQERSMADQKNGC